VRSAFGRASAITRRLRLEHVLGPAVEVSRYGRDLRIAFIIAALSISGCKSSAPEGPCSCVPENTARITSPLSPVPITGPALVAALRRHATDVRLGKNARDIKVIDDELRFVIIDFCQPCGGWVQDRMTMEEMFPLDRLDDATSAVCMGLVLRDGTTAYGSTRPRACH
jgi:hypothetical protein